MSLGMVNIANSFYDQNSTVQATLVLQIAKSTWAELWYSFCPRWPAVTYYTEQIRRKGLIYKLFEVTHFSLTDVSKASFNFG